MAKIDDKTITRIQELAKKGAKAAKIAEALDISVTAARKYAKMRAATPTAAPSNVDESKSTSGAVRTQPGAPKMGTHMPEVKVGEKPPKDSKAPKGYAVLFGSHVTRQGIEAAAAALEPGKVRKHAVVVAGKTFPVCQIVAAAATIPHDRKRLFTSEDAKRVLVQLDFAVVTSQTA